MNCNSIIPDCYPTVNLNEQILSAIQYFKPGVRKILRMIAKQYIINIVESHPKYGYDNDGSVAYPFVETETAIFRTMDKPNYKVEYNDTEGNEFFWLFKM